MRFMMMVIPKGYDKAAADFAPIQVKSRAEAIEWAKRAPMLDGDIIELRHVQGISDFPPAVQKAAWL